MPTRGETLKHVFDVRDIPDDARKFLIENEGCRTVTSLAQNAPANFTGMRTRSNGVLHHNDVNFLQIFSKWYNEEYLDEEITEDLEEVFYRARMGSLLEARNLKTGYFFQSFTGPPKIS